MINVIIVLLELYKNINMKIIIILTLSISMMLNVSCQNQNKQDYEKYLVTTLETAENLKDLELIKSIYGENAILYTPELMPISGIQGITSLYEFIFSRGNVETVRYIVDSIYNEQNNITEQGISITKKQGQSADTSDFKIVFQEINNGYKISEIYFGKQEKIKRKLPKFIEPTGKYQVGQKTYFYDKVNSGNNRLLSFQIWYPAQIESDIKAVYQSEEVVAASAKFLGFPLFMINYFSLMKSNSSLNVPVFPNKEFPVLLYNHGYGGFTSVYQTIFEDLASHGYIVVSIGHENESALLIVEDSIVISNNPQNEFYTSRAPELRGSEIGQWQNVILNSDNVKENREAYQKIIELTPLHNESIRLWKSDTKVAYAKLLELNKTDKNLNGAFDFEKVGAFGHSVGGAVAGELAYSCNATKAAINLDGFQFGDLINNNLKIPFMFVSSNRSENRYLRALTFMDKSEADCYQVAIKGFSHDNFTDLKYLLEGDSKMIQLQRELILNFFNKYLKNKEIDLKEIEKKYSDIRLLKN
jgi:dienelactone hydrolase